MANSLAEKNQAEMHKAKLEGRVMVTLEKLINGEICRTACFAKTPEEGLMMCLIWMNERERENAAVA